MTADLAALAAFFAARLDEDEAAARRLADMLASAPGTDLAICFDDNTSGNAFDCNPWDCVADYDPARALREVAAGRELLDQYDRLARQRTAHEKALAEWNADVEREERTGKWEGAGNPGSRSLALRREADYLGAMEPVLRLLIAAKAAVWRDHADYRQEWAP